MGRNPGHVEQGNSSHSSFQLLLFLCLKMVFSLVSHHLADVDAMHHFVPGQVNKKRANSMQYVNVQMDEGD